MRKCATRKELREILVKVYKVSVTVLLILALNACQSAYYSGMEKVGIHKRDILVDRIEDVQDAQEEGKEQFADALEQFRSVVQFDGGELEDQYDALNHEYKDSKAAAENISDRIDSVESVANALFEEWEEELKQYSNANLRRDSAAKLKSTKAQYETLLRAMHKAESSIEPVLRTLNDNVLYLKHNLNARAVSALKGELAGIDRDTSLLLKDMQTAIDQSNRFIDALNQ